VIIVPAIIVYAYFNLGFISIPETHVNRAMWIESCIKINTYIKLTEYKDY